VPHPLFEIPAHETERFEMKKIVHYGSAYIKLCGRDVLKFKSSECWTGVKKAVTCPECIEKLKTAPVQQTTHAIQT